MPIILDINLCPRNHECPLVAICPVEAISQQEDGLPIFDADICIECGVCVQECGKGAVSLQDE